MTWTGVTSLEPNCLGFLGWSVLGLRELGACGRQGASTMNLECLLPSRYRQDNLRIGINNPLNLSIYIILYIHIQFGRSVLSDCLQPHESQHARPPCPSPTPGVHSNSRPSSQWCHPALSSSVVPFSSCPQSKSTYWIVQGSLLNTLWSFVKRKPKENR